MKKADKIFVRIGFSDMLIPLEESYVNKEKINSSDYYVVGYEDEDGKECHEDGTYLNQE